MTKNQCLAADYHTFTGLVKMRLKFWPADFGSFSDFQTFIFRCKSRESYTPDFDDKLDEGQVIHERYWKQNNAHTNIAIAHIHTEQQLFKNAEAVAF